MQYCTKHPTHMSAKFKDVFTAAIFFIENRYWSQNNSSSLALQ